MDLLRCSLVEIGTKRQRAMSALMSAIIPAFYQPQNRQGARPENSPGVARCRRRSDRVVALFAAAHESVLGT
jgi:hypothetical protein